MTATGRLLGGRYEVGELLGYGGMAEVHRGRDRRLGRDVAIKMLRTDLARDHTFQLRFRREAQNAATLNHPGIVAVYDTGEEQSETGESLPYIVMEFVSGHTLKDVLATEGRLQPRRALEIAADVCAALEFSHRHGIVHRDVKPGNVMITPNGQVKVMDFGIARDLASGATTMTQTSAVIGTAQYLSPEQARGESVDARSDVYATGCVLFELLCGHPPFVGDSPVSVAYQHVREEPRPPSQLNPEIGPDVDAVVLKALAKNPANRYQSAAEMRADLLRAASGRPVLATPVMSGAETAVIGSGGGRGEPARVGDPERRRASTWVLTALAVLGVLAVVALIVGLVLANQGPATTSVPDVRGMSGDDAVAEIEAANLEPEAGQPVTENCQYSEDRVERQSPGPGESLTEGETVTYQLCGVPEEVTIPSGLVGSQQSSAEQRLEDVGLVPVVETEDSGRPAGEVTRVEPEEGETVAYNTEVIIYVSEGNLDTVPDVTGDPRDVAIGRLEQAGFQADVQQYDQPAPAPEEVGTVAEQEPVGNTEGVESGSTVTIWVYPEGEDLTAAIVSEEPTEDEGALVVTISWDNDIFGGVTIDWGDGTQETHNDASGDADHTYTGPGLPITITVSATDERYPDREIELTSDGV